MEKTGTEKNKFKDCNSHTVKQKWMVRKPLLHIYNDPNFTYFSKVN